MTASGALPRTGALVLALALAASLAGCSGTTLAAKVGVPEPERTLVLADPAIPGLAVGSLPIIEFAADVARRSRGLLRVEIRTGLTHTDEERRVVADVASGRVDLGWAEAHTLEAMGATSLRPLFVPLLVDSYPLEEQVLMQYSAQLLADVPRALGVTPLALLAGGLRFPAAADHPVVTAADWSGRSFAVLSPGQEGAGVEALGARPVLDARDRQTLTQAGLIDSAETTWRAYPASLRFVAPNVHLWPRAVVLVAGPAVLGELSDRQRGWLEGAAADAARWAARHAGDADRRGLVDACRTGTKAGLAAAAQLDAMRAAGLRTLRSSTFPDWTGSLVAELDRLRRQPGYEPVTAVPPGCAFGPADGLPRAVGRRAALDGPGPTGSLPRGTYRYTLTQAEILAASHGGAVGEYLSGNAGLWTWTVTDGRWSLDMRPTDSTFPVYPCAGWISVSADVATFTRTVNGLPGGDCVPLVWSARFRVQDGVVRWSETDVADFGWVFQPKPWVRIG